MSAPASVWLPQEGVQIGYTRRSEECVSSSWWAPGALRDMFVAGLLASYDVREVWYRDPITNAATHIKLP